LSPYIELRRTGRLLPLRVLHPADSSAQAWMM
jgi:hypothetical protein